ERMIHVEAIGYLACVIQRRAVERQNRSLVSRQIEDYQREEDGVRKVAKEGDRNVSVDHGNRDEIENELEWPRVQDIQQWGLCKNEPRREAADCHAIDSRHAEIVRHDIYRHARVVERRAARGGQ